MAANSNRPLSEYGWLLAYSLMDSPLNLGGSQLIAKSTGTQIKAHFT